MNALTTWTFEDRAVRQMTDAAGEPWFVAKDVCDSLAIRNSRHAVSRLPADERNTVAIGDGIRGNPNLTIVNEPGLYRLTFSSRTPMAEKFKRWVTHEVLPAIRRTGSYTAPGREPLAEATLEPADREIAPGDSFLASAEANKVKLEMVRTYHMIRGNSRALALWRMQELPEPPFADGAAARVQFDDAAARGALDHLLASDTGQGTVRELLASADTAAANRALAPLGVKRSGGGPCRGMLAIAPGEGLDALYRDTPWDGRRWRAALAALPGALRNMAPVWIGGRQSRAVWLPAELWAAAAG